MCLRLMLSKRRFDLFIFLIFKLVLFTPYPKSRKIKWNECSLCQYWSCLTELLLFIVQFVYYSISVHKFTRKYYYWHSHVGRSQSRIKLNWFRNSYVKGNWWLFEYSFHFTSYFFHFRIEALNTIWISWNFGSIGSQSQ